MSEDSKLKCPICGTDNLPDTEQCKLCMTKLSVDETTKKISVVQPSDGGDIFSMIDLEDPQTRKELEELLLIPGVTKRKALYLYRSGITSLEDFIDKAFHGDRHGKNFSRIVANKLIMEDLKKGRSQPEEIECVTCTNCNTRVELKAGKCHICGHELAKEIEDVDMGNVSETLSEVAEAMVTELAEDDDFAHLPDEMKAQVASILDSDDLGPDDISTVVESLGEEFKGLDVADEPEQTADASEESTIETKKEAAPVKKTKAERKKDVLLGKIKDWYTKGYDVSGLYPLIDGDIEDFKIAAQEMLRKGKRED